MTRYRLWSGLLIAAGLAVAGCGKSASTPQTTASTADEKSTAEGIKGAAEVPTKPKREIKPVEIGATGSAGASSANSGERVESARAALKPLQILIGNWTGNARNKENYAELGWAWDLKSDPKQPALRIKSEKGLYVRDGRLTFSPSSQEYEFTSTDGEDKKRVFRGGFSQDVQDVLGDDKKLQRTYKLELTEAQPSAEGEQWRVVINQQENNRYIMELYRKRGSGQFLRVDSINTQREGTSFALSDTDYGDKTCVVSQGLGTTEVKYKGKSYWVCCSGCKAAFEDEPEKWIAKYEAMNKDKMPKP